MRFPRTCRAAAGLAIMAALAGCVTDDQTPGSTAMVPTTPERLADGRRRGVPPPPPGGHPGAPAADPTAVAPADREGFVVVSENRVTAGRQVYRVQPGETLAGIARRFYGDRWEDGARAIFEANRDTMADPNRLAVGTELRLP